MCNKELPAQDESASSGQPSSSSKEEDSERDVLLRPHVIGCASLRDAKQKVDKALELGSKMPCPSCNLLGRKDDSCCHMSCPRCQTSWCYICGLSVEACDKAPPRGPRLSGNDIFLHNVDWETNPARCPMYLTQILEIDPSWLGQDWNEGDEVDDDRLLSYFHRWRTIKLLQSVLVEIGNSTFEQVWLHFDSVRNAGYELEDIFHTDTSMLIDRDGWQDQADLASSSGEASDLEDNTSVVGD